MKVKNTLKRTEAKAANDGTRLSGLKGNVKYPKELNPFGSSSEDSLPSSEQTSKCVLGQEPVNQQDVKSSSSRRKRNRRKKKVDKYPKEFNPFGEESSNEEEGSLSSESESHPCKERPEKDSEVIDGPGTSKDIYDRDGKGRGTNNGDAIVSKNDSGDIEQGGAVVLETSLVQDEPALEKEKPNIPVDGVSELEQGNGEESPNKKEEVDGRNSSPDDSPVTCKDLDERDDKDKETNDGNAIIAKKDSSDIEHGGAVLLETSIFQDEPALEKAKTYVPVNTVNKFEQGSGEKSSKQREGIDDHCSMTDDGPHTCKDLVESDGREKGINAGDAIVSKSDSSDIEQGGAVLLEISLVQDEPNELEQGSGEVSSRQKEGIHGHCRMPDDPALSREQPNELEEDTSSEGKDRDSALCSVSDECVQQTAKSSSPSVVKGELKEANGEESLEREEGGDDPCSNSDETVLNEKKPYDPVVGIKKVEEPKDEESSQEQEGEHGLCSTADEPVLKRAKPYVPVMSVEELQGAKYEESAKQQEGEHGLCSTTDEPVLKRAKPYVPVILDEELDEVKDEQIPKPQEEDNDLCSTPGKPVTKRRNPMLL